MTWRTNLPTQTDDDLGLEKLDRDAVIDPRKDDSAAQINRRNLDLIELFRRFGLASDGAQAEVNPTAFRSLEARLSPDVYCLRETFDAPVAGLVRWATAGTFPDVLATRRAGLSFPLASVRSAILHGYYFARSQVPYVRFRAVVTGPDPDDMRAMFCDVAVQEGWGVRLEASGTKIVGWTMTGGVPTYIDAATWTISTECVIEMWVYGDHVWIAKDGGAGVDCGPTPLADVGFVLINDGAGTAGKVCEIRNCLLLANWAA